MMNLKKWSLFLIGIGTLIGQTPPPPPTGIPVDGGISAILAMGAGYGIYKIREIRRKN